jgi:hypothetical protein
MTYEQQPLVDSGQIFGGFKGGRCTQVTQKKYLKQQPPHLSQKCSRDWLIGILYQRLERGGLRRSNLRYQTMERELNE